MQNDYWKSICDIVSVVKPDFIDKDAITTMLSYDRMWDMQVVDTLYKRRIIDIEEYKTFLDRHIEILEDSVRFEKKIKESTVEKGENYDPMVNYCCCSSVRYSPIIRNELNSKFG